VLGDLPPEFRRQIPVAFLARGQPLIQRDYFIFGAWGEAFPRFADFVLPKLYSNLQTFNLQTFQRFTHPFAHFCITAVSTDERQPSSYSKQITYK
jgi:hypothetical protein